MIERRNLVGGLALAPLFGASVARAEAPGDALQASRRSQTESGTALIDIRSEGAKVDSVADDAEVVARAGSRGAILFPSGVTRIARDVVIDHYAEAAAGAVISPARGVTVTFAGGFWAPLTRAFAGEGAIAFKGLAQSIGHPEWWGARPDDPATDCASAINACLAACPVTQLQQGAYHIAAPLILDRPGRSLRGINDSQDPKAPCSEIIVDSRAPAALVCGPESDSHHGFVDYLTLENFTVRRQLEGPASSPDLARGSAGVRLRWCSLAHAHRVTVLDYAVGFNLFGCVECYFVQCSALVGKGAFDAGSKTCGFFLDYAAPLGLAGGNASIYFERCRAFGEEEAILAYSAGLATRGGFVDLMISKFETGFQHFGIDLNGDGPDSKSYSTQDCHIVDCMLDSNAVAGLRVQSAGRHCDVRMSGCYIALQGRLKTSTCVELGGSDPNINAVNGVVTISNCEFIGDFSGVVATNTAVCNLALNTYLNLGSPISFTGVRHSEIRDSARILRPLPVRAPVVRLEGCEGIAVACSVSGIPMGFDGAVALNGDSKRIEINLTRIDEEAVGGAARRILVGGEPWGGAAAFGKGNLVTGAL